MRYPRLRSSGRALLLGTGVAVAAATARSDPGDFRGFLEAYAQVLLTGSAEASRAYWWPDDLRHSERLEIRYRGHGTKIDGASILVLAADPLRKEGTQLDIALLEPDGRYARLELSLREHPDALRTTYYGQWDRERWWLRHLLLLATEDWPVVESVFLWLIRHVETPPTPWPWASSTNSSNGRPTRWG